MEEIWKDIKGYEGLYQVSNLGNVRKLEEIIPTHKITPFMNNNGQLRVSLYKDKTHKSINVNRLVAEAFIPNEENLRIVGHKDKNNKNNCVDNLFWTNIINFKKQIEKEIEDIL